VQKKSSNEHRLSLLSSTNDLDKGWLVFFLIVCVLSWLSHEAALPGPDAMPLGGDAYLFVSICDSITLTKCFSVYETGMGTPGGVEDVPGST